MPICFLLRDDLAKKYNDPSFHSNVYLCIYKKEIDDKIFGLGKLGGACSPTRESHSLIMGYDFNDIIVGTVSMIFIAAFSHCSTL